MSVAYLKTKIEERAGLTDASSAILDKCAAESRDPNPEERAQLDSWSTRCKSLDAEIGVLEAQFRGDNAFSTLLDRMSKRDEDNERREAQRRREPVETRKSIGQAFVDSDAFKNYSGHGSMGRVEFALDQVLETRAAITTGDLNIPPYQFAAAPPTTTSPLLNAIGHERVSSNAVDYVVWGGSAGNASVVPEGALKPEADFTSASESTTLDTYAWWKEITRQALEDAPRMRSIIETKLRAGIANALEAAAATLIAGTDFTNVVNADLLAGIRQAIGKVQSVGYNPTSVLLNPDDYADLDIDAAASSNSGPTQYGRYWGLEIIPAAAVVPGTAYVADFKEAVTWFDRNSGAVYMTDSHADNFLRNKLLILAETRAAFAVTDFNAAASVSKTPPVASRAAAKA